MNVVQNGEELDVEMGKEGERVDITIGENMVVAVKHNDVGISIDVYAKDGEKHVIMREDQFWFTDFEPKDNSLDLEME